MDYFSFHSNNKGYEFRDKKTNRIYGKSVLWQKYQDEIADLGRLCDGIHKEYERVEKKDYRNGVFIGIREGAQLSRVYRECRDKQPPPDKRRNKNGESSNRNASL
jgi:hypothetical protein